MPRTSVSTSAAPRALALTVLLAVLLPALGIAWAAPAVSAAAPTTVVGGDVSWPQCPVGMGIRERRSLGLPLPGARARFVVIGLTNGPAFTPNPCLAEQVAWARTQALPTSAYAVATWPTPRQLALHGTTGPYAGTTRLSRLRNVGYAEGTDNMARLASAGLTVPHVWIDVEHYPVRPWSGDRRANRAVVRGIVRAYQDAGLQTGFYSTTLQWPDIVGRVRWGLPEWHTAGPRGRAVALTRCTEPSFQDGPIVLAQWWTSDADRDLVCPTRPMEATAPTEAIGPTEPAGPVAPATAVPATVFAAP